MGSFKILIEGEAVQNVDYRLFLANQALLHGIEHFYAVNVNTSKVLVLVNGDESKIVRFYETVQKARPEGASPSTVEKEPYNEDVSIPSITTYINLLSLDQLIRGREGLAALTEGVKSIGDSIERLPDKIIDSFVNRLKSSSV